MGCWGLSLGLETAFTYDEKHFKRIDGLAVKEASLTYLRGPMPSECVAKAAARTQCG